MTPRTTPNDATNRGLMQAIAIRQRLLTNAALRIQGTNGSYVIIGKRGASICCTTTGPADSFASSSIAFMRAPLKIIGTIVGLCIVPMAHDSAGKRRWAVERDGNHSVDKARTRLPIAVKANVKVATRRWQRLQELGFVFRVTAGRIRSYATQIGNRIRFTERLIRDRFPYLFHSILLWILYHRNLYSMMNNRLHWRAN